MSEVNLANPHSALAIKNSKIQIPKPYRDIAQGMEKQFVQFMVEQMKKSAPSESTGTAMDYYNSLLTEKQSEMMTEAEGGVGIQELVLKQIYPRYFEQQKFNAKNVLNAYKNNQLNEQGSRNE